MPSLVLSIVRQLYKIMNVVPYSHLTRFSSLVEVAVSSMHPGARGRTVPLGRIVAAARPEVVSSHIASLLFKLSHSHLCLGVLLAVMGVPSAWRS